MRPLQAEIIHALHVQPTIDPAAEIERRVSFIAEYATTVHAKSLVLGISGGQDSSLTGRLAQLAAERVREQGHELRFIAVRLPYNVQADEDDAQLALGFIAPDSSLVFNVAGAVDGFESEYQQSTGEQISDFVKGNVKARARAVAQFAIAGQHQGLVLGTDHAAEAVTGFFTKFGDGAADLTPLTGLTKGQGADLLRALGAPARLYEKAPTADLLDTNPGQTDEANLGVGYAVIDAYLRGEDIAAADARNIETRYLQTEHKRVVPITPFDDWWRKISTRWAR